MYLLIAFICAGLGLALALSRKYLPAAIALFILAGLLFYAQITHHP